MEDKKWREITELEERLEFSGWLGGDGDELGECPEEEQPCSCDETTITVEDA